MKWKLGSLSVSCYNIWIIVVVVQIQSLDSLKARSWLGKHGLIWPCCSGQQGAVHGASSVALNVSEGWIAWKSSLVSAGPGDP